MPNVIMNDIEAIPDRTIRGQAPNRIRGDVIKTDENQHPAFAHARISAGCRLRKDESAGLIADCSILALILLVCVPEIEKKNGDQQ